MNRSASRLSLCGAIFDASKKRLELSKSEELISSPDFWNDSERSQKLMQERKRLEKAIGEDGYLAEKGIVTLPGAEADKTRAVAKDMTPMSAEGLK